MTSPPLFGLVHDVERQRRPLRYDEVHLFKALVTYLHIKPSS